MWETRIDLERRVPYQLCRQERRVCNRDDLIVIAVQDERRDIDLLRPPFVQIFAQHDSRRAYLPFGPESASYST